MAVATDLHLYLDQRPAESNFPELLELYGFTYVKEVEKTKAEPHTTYFSWSLPSLSSTGFKLLYFDTLFPDDLNFGTYESFVILSAYKNSSETDFKMLDVMAVLLLNRYGGRLHNPQRIEKISTSYLLSGAPFSANMVKSS